MNACRARIGNGALAFICASFGLLVMFLYALDAAFPIWLSMTLSCGVGALYMGRTPLLDNVLFKYFLVLYALPFIHGFEYIGFDFARDARPNLMWGLLTNAYTFSEPILQRTFMLAFIGLLAMVTGALIAQPIPAQPQENTRLLESYAALPLGKFLGILAFAFLLSWLNTPKESILLRAYATSAEPAVSSLNFNASWMLSYICLVALFIDQEFLSNSLRLRRLKRVALLGTTGYIVVCHQFMRGDRECITLIAAFFLLFLFKVVRAASQGLGRRSSLRTLAGLGLFVGLVVLVANIVGSVRSTLAQNPSDQELWEAIRISLAHFYAGTWSAVLLTPLSVVGDMFHGMLDLRWGSTYLDSLLSLIPSPIAKALEYARPIEGTRGPAWEMRFGIGGTHIAVVPYMNFGIAGVYVMMLLQGAAFACIDRSAQEDCSFSKIFLMGTLIVVGPHWYWYGDMSLVRGLMAYGIVWLLYCFLAVKVPRPLTQQLS